MRFLGLFYLMIGSVLLLVSCKNGIKKAYTYSGEEKSYSNDNHGGTDSSTSTAVIKVEETKDSIFFESQHSELAGRFVKNDSGRYESSIYSHARRSYRFSGDSLYAYYGYSNAVTVISWGYYAGVREY